MVFRLFTTATRKLRVKKHTNKSNNNNNKTNSLNCEQPQALETLLSVEAGTTWMDIAFAATYVILLTVWFLYSKLPIGHTEQCPCSTGSQTIEDLLQSCPIYEPLKKGIWPDHTPVARKLYKIPAMHCHLHRGDWSFHLTDEKKKTVAHTHSVASSTGLPKF